MRSDIVKTKSEVYAVVRWRMFADRYARPPFPRRPDRSDDKTAAAVRADILKLVLDAVRTERAFIAADACFHGVMRAIFVIPRCAIAHRGCASGRRPGIHTPCRGYGFRVRSFHSRPGMTTKTNNASAPIP